jgi:hypothetical protein
VGWGEVATGKDSSGGAAQEPRSSYASTGGTHAGHNVGGAASRDTLGGADTGNDVELAELGGWYGL